MTYQGRLDGAENFPNIFPSLTKIDKAMAGLGGVGTGLLATESISNLPIEGKILALVALTAGLIWGGVSQDKGASVKKNIIHPDAPRLSFFDDKGPNLASKARLDDSDLAEPKE